LFTRGESGKITTRPSEKTLSTLEEFDILQGYIATRRKMMNVDLMCSASRAK